MYSTIALCGEGQENDSNLSKVKVEFKLLDIFNQVTGYADINFMI